MAAEPSFHLQVEYLEALKVFREAGISTAVPVLARQVEVSWAEHEILPVARFIYRPNENIALKRVEVAVNPALSYVTSYRVERLEILTYIAAESLAYLMRFGAPELGAICIKLGCANTRLMTPRERWRRLGVELDPREKSGDRSRSLVALMYEDRPSCGWCKHPIATLSGHAVRKDLHDNCYQYIKRIVIPQIAEERHSAKLAEENAKNG